MKIRQYDKQRCWKVVKKQLHKNLNILKEKKYDDKKYKEQNILSFLEKIIFIEKQ